jgi:hypothetical protein
MESMRDLGVRADPILDLGRLDRFLAGGTQVTSAMAGPRFSPAGHEEAGPWRSFPECDRGASGRRSFDILLLLYEGVTILLTV